MEFIKIHPTYKNYGHNVESNEIVHIPTNRNVKQRTGSCGYCLVSINLGGKQCTELSHRFVWECNNCVIKKGYEIDHIDKNIINNNITNLRCITIQENRKNRDHTNIINIAKIAHTMKRFMKAIHIDSGDSCCFSSKSKCAKYFGISPAMVYLIAENKNNCTCANTNKGKYKFEYIDEKDVENVVIVPHGRSGMTYNTDPDRIYKTTEAQRKAIKHYREKIKQSNFVLA